jgi:hypothetical protein
MTEIIFTYRPRKLGKPISLVNRITRRISQSPYDHVLILEEGIVYESSAGKGVHSQKFELWKQGREGTHLYCYEVPKALIDRDLMMMMEGKPYDYRSAFLHFLRMKKAMKKRMFEAFTCSEFVGFVIGLDNWWSALPEDVSDYCEMRNFPLDKREL